MLLWSLRFFYGNYAISPSYPHFSLMENSVRKLLLHTSTSVPNQCCSKTHEQSCKPLCILCQRLTIARIKTGKKKQILAKLARDPSLPKLKYVEMKLKQLSSHPACTCIKCLWVCVKYSKKSCSLLVVPKREGIIYFSSWVRPVCAQLKAQATYQWAHLMEYSLSSDKSHSNK